MTAKKKRKPKKGFVYLLKSNNEAFGKEFFKYGCTGVSIKSRQRCANRTFKGEHVFSAVCAFESNDVFSDENLVKWDILDFGLGAMSEFITPFDDMTGDDLVSRFKKILSHLSEVAV